MQNSLQYKIQHNILYYKHKEYAASDPWTFIINPLDKLDNSYVVERVLNDFFGAFENWIYIFPLEC